MKEIRTAKRQSDGSGLNGAGSLTRRPVESPLRKSQSLRPVLLTGGAGFIGTNLAVHLLRAGRRVILFDNLSRPGVETNLRWLLEQFGDRVDLEIADVRDARMVRWAVSRSDSVVHLAAQVAVTTSLGNPTNDFEINAEGTLNVLEACRRMASPPPLLFTSTNKVYGSLSGLRLFQEGDRYVPLDRRVRDHGIGEDQPLEFHSPYGCSKGTADQYVLDYARCFHLPAVVFRMSCIYGPYQCGSEDQGWVAHFVRQALAGETITLFGDGRQVRDLLYVDDLVRAMLAVLEGIQTTRGCVFNVGGGPAHAVSLLDVVELIRRLDEEPLPTLFAPRRQGDQRYYVSDTRALGNATGWRPRIDVRTGIGHLYRWLKDQQDRFSDRAAVA